MVNRASNLFASDALPFWKKTISSATQSILIVGPYLDDLLLDLLREAKLPSGNITVLTDLSDSSSALTYRKQLLTLHKILELGIAVKSVERLHAKLILVDDQIVTSGSQNFTRYARKSKEVSATFEISENREPEIEVQKWLAAAVDVSTDLIIEILNGIEEELSDAEDANLKLGIEVKKILQSYWSPERKHYLNWRSELPDRISSLIKQEQVENLQSPKYCQIRSPYDSHYLSLMSDWSDLTSWSVLSDDNHPLAKGKLKRLHMYPILFSDTGIMGFARVSKSRITYIRRDVVRGQTFKLLNFNVLLTVVFPIESERVSNIRVSVGRKNGISDIVNFDLLFDGESIILVSDNIDELLARKDSESPSMQRSYLRNKEFWELLKIVRSKESLLRQLFIDATQPFVYDSLGSGNHNISSYASGNNYRLGLVRKDDFLCLLAECVDSQDH